MRRIPISSPRLQNGSKALIEGLPYLALLGIVLLVRPFGDYPLNDDWQYARVTKAFIATGVFKSDVQIAPSLVGQALLVWPLVKLFGFSHGLLRGASLLMGATLLACLQVIMRQLRLPPVMIAGLLLSFLLSPLTLYFSFSFMTEIYGFAVAMVGAAWWFQSRTKLAGPHAAPIGAWLAMGVGFLCGLSFWIRQYAALVYPALLGAALVPPMLARDWQHLRRSLVGALLGFCVFAGVIASYFRWALVSGNFRNEFASPLEQLLTISQTAWKVQPGVFTAYLTLMFLPCLLLLARRATCGRAWLIPALLVSATVVLAYCKLQRIGDSGGHPPAWFHNHFPYLGNVIHDGGIGPIILQDVYEMNLASQPRLSAQLWRNVERLMWVGTLLWAPLVVLLSGLLKPRRKPAPPQAASCVAAEVLWFGLLFVFGSAFVVIQTYSVHVFDRYLFPLQIGMVLVIAVAFAEVQRRAISLARARGRWLVASLAGFTAFCLAWFSVAGVHDQFRWNDVRWAMYRGLLGSGISPLNIDAGWEAQGWTNLDAYLAGATPPHCIGPCHCEGGWYCRDDSYRVGMNVFDGYEVIDQVTPRFLLVDPVALYVSRRPAP